MIRRSIIIAAFAACMFTAGNTGMISNANAAVIGPVTSSAPLSNVEIANPKLTEVGKRRHRYRRRGGAGLAAGFAFGLILGHALNSQPDYYYYKRSPRRSHGSRCSYWADRCADNWGYRTKDYYGCLRYHDC